jgi:hypothetical protein
VERQAPFKNSCQVLKCDSLTIAMYPKCIARQIRFFRHCSMHLISFNFLPCGEKKSLGRVSIGYPVGKANYLPYQLWWTVVQFVVVLREFILTQHWRSSSSMMLTALFDSPPSAPYISIGVLKTPPINKSKKCVARCAESAPRYPTRESSVFPSEAQGRLERTRSGEPTNSRLETPDAPGLLELVLLSNIEYQVAVIISPIYYVPRVSG